MRLLGVADRGRDPRVGDRDDDVGRDGALAGELPAEGLPHLVDVAAVDPAVGPGEVDVLEHAVVRVARERADRLHAPLAQRDDLPWLDLTLVARVDQVERAGLRGDHEGVTDPAEDERTEAPRIAGRDDPVLGQEDERVGPPHLTERVDDPPEEHLLLRGRDQVDDDLAVDRRLEDRPTRLELRAQLLGVHQVPVVGDPERALRPLDDEGLAVLEHGRPARRIAVVADREPPLEPRQHVLPEDLGNVPHPPVADERLAIGGDDAGGLLATVLQGVQCEVRQRSGLGVAVDANDATLFVELVEHPARLHCSRGDALCTRR